MSRRKKALDEMIGKLHKLAMIEQMNKWFRLRAARCARRTRGLEKPETKPDWKTEGF